MKRSFRQLLLLVALLPAVVWGRTEFVVQYDVRLDEVTCDRPAGYRQGITEQTFTDLDGRACRRFRYEDDNISCVWYVSDIAFNFSLIDKRPAQMVVPWSSVSYTDIDRSQCGVGYALEPSDELLPSVVPGGTGVSGFLIPDIHYPMGVETDITPILPSRFRSRMAAQRTADDLKRHYMKVHIPMTIGAARISYWFTFVVDGVASIRKESVRRPDEAAVEAAVASLPEGDQLVSLPETLAEGLMPNAVIPSDKVRLEDQITADYDSLSLELQQLAAYWQAFSRVCPQERVWLHLDNTAYFRGETIWYAAYVTDDMGYTDPASRVLYVELLSPTGVILKQHKLKIENGRCHGAFSLVDTSVKVAIDRRGATNLPSGYYQIRAYTHSMLNFDDACIFSRVIPVYEFPEEAGQYRSPVMGSYPYREVYRPQPPKTKKNAEGLTVSFFPEGGHLVAGVPCRVAFKVTDGNGLGVDADALLTADGAAVPFDSVRHRGMGSFMWKTDKGDETLTAVVGDRRIRAALPKAEKSGCALQVTTARGGMHVHLDAVGMGGDENALVAYTLTGRGRLCAFDTLRVASTNDTIVYQHDGSPVMVRQVRRGAVSYDLDIPVDRCPTGVCQLTFFNPAGDVLAQRMLFIDNGARSLPVTYTATKPEYKPYERVQMTFRSAGKAGETFSLAVRDAADYGTSYADDIRTGLLLSSELKGLIEHPEEYFRKDGAGAIDLLMMVQGWTRYDWRQMAGVTPFKVRHYTEQQLVLDGWAFSRILEKPLQNTQVSIFLASPDRTQEQRATVRTDREGYWSVGLEDFYGKWHFYYETEQEEKIRKEFTTRMRLERSFKPGLYPYTPLETFLPDPEETNALLPVWRDDISDFVQPHDAIQLDEVEVTAGVLYVDYGTFHAYDAGEACEDIFDEGDYTYDIERYLYKIGFYDNEWSDTLDTPDVHTHKFVCQMAENGMSLERAHRWMTREIDMEFIRSVLVYDSINDPRVLPCFQEKMREFSPEMYSELVEWILRGDKFLIAEVIYGEPAYNERRQKNARLTTFSGYTPQPEFYAPTYPDGPVQGDRDTRRTLYWNPEVTTDKEGSATLSFYNNGYSRTFKVSVEGIAADGCFMQAQPGMEETP